MVCGALIPWSAAPEALKAEACQDEIEPGLWHWSSSELKLPRYVLSGVGSGRPGAHENCLLVPRPLLPAYRQKNVAHWTRARHCMFWHSTANRATKSEQHFGWSFFLLSFRGSSYFYLPWHKAAWSFAALRASNANLVKHTYDANKGFDYLVPDTLTTALQYRAIVLQAAQAGQ